MKEVAAWLDQLGLARYMELFASNDLDWEVLPELENQDLLDIGITSLGHRKKILRSIAELSQPQAPVATPETDKAQVESERRQVTVMFCDLVGSTALSTLLDPEDMDAVIRRYQEAVTPVVHEFGGHVARFSGDGILNYFGYPQALEHEAERAILAALKAASVVDKAEFHPGTHSQVRIGIATGDVVVGGVYDQGTLYEAMATGETPNLAARLQGVAQPGGIAVCNNTRLLAGQLFRFEDAGVRSLRGFSNDVQVWTVAGKADSGDRFKATRSRGGWTPLSGREDEYGVLRENWRAAAQSHGGSVLVTGEPGIGKSRLFKTLDDDIPRSHATRIRLYCEPYYQGTPFYPLINYLLRSADLDPEDPLEVKRARFDSFVESVSAQAKTDLPFFYNLLDIVGDQPHPELTRLSPLRLKEKTIEAAVSLVGLLAGSKPVLMLVDDLQWADPTTAQFLESLHRRTDGLPLLIVMTSRPGLELNWQSENPVNVIELKGLDDEQVFDVIDRVSGDVDLPDEIRLQIRDKSDGNPLYVEELTRNMIEGFRDPTGEPGTTPDVSDMSVPNALQSSLMARLDRLAGVKEFALTCSVIGREFSSDLAAMVSGQTTTDTGDALRVLVDADMIRAPSVPSSKNYVFSHALLRDAAYSNLLRSRRSEIHAKVADTLETHFPQTVINEPERLAHHHSGAGNHPAAISYLLNAGSKALQGGANLEAADHLGRGLDLLDNIDEDVTRLGLELQLLMTRAPALISIRGFAAEEVEQTFERARQLCELMGASEQLFPVLRGLMAFYIVRADYESSLEVGRELQGVINSSDSTGHRLELAWNLGSSKLYRGDLEEAMVHFEEGLSLYDPAKHAVHALVYGQDPGIATMTHYAIGLNLMGQYDRAIKVENDIVKLARQLDHPFTTAQANGFLEGCVFVRQEYETLVRMARDNAVFCQQQGFPVFMAQAMMYQGWCKAVAGNPEGIELTAQGVEIYRLSGAEISMSHYLSLLADGQLACGRQDECSQTLDDAIRHMESRNERFFEAELYLKKARLLRAEKTDNGLAEARVLLARSIDVARQRGQKHYQLQAAIEWVDLAQKNGDDLATALEYLNDLYNSMDQGRHLKIMTTASSLLADAGPLR